MEAYDVAVIGGGIIGCSAANHLAAAGYRTILMEQLDLAGATSGRTSRLQYCGLSYFSRFRSVLDTLSRPGEAWEGVELARRAMRDRSGFVRQTPERVRPITFFFPLYRDGSIPLWQVRLGFSLLERLDPGGVPLDQSLLSPEEARREPVLAHLRDPDRLVGVMHYTEYQFDWPERICVDAALNAEDNGASIANHTAVTSLARRPDGVWSIATTDRRTSASGSVEARAVVNAAGVWVDDLAAASRLTVPPVNQGCKGTNVMVRLPEAFRGLGFETMTRGGEPFYVIPWDDLHYFGPRNKAHDSSADGFLTSEDEVTGLIDEMNYQFPALGLRRQDVIYSWSGVRPRTARRGHPAGGPAVMLHDFARQGLPGYYVYTGGLLMTHRSAGRAIVAGVARRLAPSGPSRAMPYGARSFPEDHNTPRISPSYPAVSISDLRFACQHEHVQRLEDLMFRRVRLGWSERMGCDIAHDVAREVRDVMGWSSAEADGEADGYIAELRRKYQLRT